MAEDQAKNLPPGSDTKSGETSTAPGEQPSKLPSPKKHEVDAIPPCPSTATPAKEVENSKPPEKIANTLPNEISQVVSKIPENIAQSPKPPNDSEIPTGKASQSPVKNSPGSSSPSKISPEIVEESVKSPREKENPVEPPEEKPQSETIASQDSVLLEGNNNSSSSSRIVTDPVPEDEEEEEEEEEEDEAMEDEHSAPEIGIVGPPTAVRDLVNEEELGSSSLPNENRNASSSRGGPDVAEWVERTAVPGLLPARNSQKIVTSIIRKSIKW